MAAGRLPLVSSDQASTSFATQTSGDHDTYLWKVVARDARGAEAPSPAWSFKTNTPPAVNAGPDRFVDGAALPGSVTLAGSATDDGLLRALSYEWAQVSGPEATLGSPAAPSTAVTLPARGRYVFRLTVDDGQYARPHAVQR